ncbi:MAG: FAD-dependent oxidoreductase, partial [Actinomycetota bacterium]
MKTSDVIVIGGGVVGASVAYFLAREGLAVTLFERDDLAAHASGAAAGMLAPICESGGGGALFDAGLRSLELFPELAAELRELSGVDPQYVQSGVLRVADTPAVAESFQAQASELSAYEVEWLDAAEAREREPHVADGILGALWSPREA